MEQHEPTFERLGRYELVRKIATGGMAELFLARFSGPGGFAKRCAVKRILPQFANDAEFVRMFYNEARVAALFSHPNIVQIYEIARDEESGQHFIAMELVDGLDLRQLLRLAREQGLDIPAELAAYMMAEALDGLAYAHEFRDSDGEPMQVVHRDVSPQNLLVSYDGVLKLVDFGIVKVTNENHTQAGLLKGKVAYMSPEQAAGEPIDGRADVFAIGVCLYELITGVKPFRGTTELMTLKAILEQEPAPITSFVPECPIGIEQAVMRALAKSPAHRFESAREFQLELRTVLRSCPVPLDRHVLSQFVRSVTEAETTRFDTGQLRIPRHVTGTQGGTGLTQGPRFGMGQTASDEAWRAEAAQAFRSALDPSRPRASGPPSVFRPVTMGTPAPISGEVAAMAVPIPAANTDSGVFQRASLEAQADADVARAAGLTRARPHVAMIIALVAAVVALGVAWLVTSPEPAQITPLPIAAPSGAAVAASPSPEPEAAGAAAGDVDRDRDRAQREAAQREVAEREVAERAAAEREAQRAANEKREAAAAAERAADRDRERDADRDRDRPRSRPRASEKAEAPAGGGKLTLASKPRGLNVSLNGRSLGTTPLEAVDLPPGKHTLTVSSQRFGIARAVVVEIKAGALTKQTLDVPRGKLSVNARPFAEVYINGEHVGTTPLTRPVYEGRHEVKLVSAAGEQTRIVDVTADQDVSVAVKF